MEEKLKKIVKEYADEGCVEDTSCRSLRCFVHFRYPEFEDRIDDMYRIFIEQHTIAKPQQYGK